jgi:hypothetical protein
MSWKACLVIICVAVKSRAARRGLRDIDAYDLAGSRGQDGLLNPQFRPFLFRDGVGTGFDCDEPTCRTQCAPRYA